MKKIKGVSGKCKTSANTCSSPLYSDSAWDMLCHLIGVFYFVLVRVTFMCHWKISNVDAPPPIFFPSFSFSSCFSCLLSFFFFFSFMPNWACYRTRLSYLFTFSPFPFFSSPLTYAWLPSNFFSSPFLFLLGPCQASLFSLLSSSFLALIRLLSSLSYFLLVGLGWA